MVARLADVRGRTLVVGAVVTIVGAIVLFAIWPMPEVEELGGGPILDRRAFASGSEADGYLNALGEEGRRLYTYLALGDLLWALVHGLTITAVAAVTITRSALARDWAPIASAGLFYLAFDLLENLSILGALNAYPGSGPVPVGVLDLLTGLKWVALGVAYLVAIVGVVAWRTSSPPPDGR